ncbi:ABC transporter permease [Staphylococcus schleiferi subsp. coagulans]|uniref:FtsX-like permease family protein n=1 Tax=Staphylococcus coagulans TaxID=74706 RepID=UPI0015F8690B|nr:ABC transporter permease [Staphylococcus coagulans]MBA8759655.1 ABC transporter permease [Staphylococcus coagulans]MBA8767565.1 ABC transporter permease [Staphylococcus coagulans]
MRFSHIVLKNFRQNLRHYAIYLFSLLLSITLYFSFVTLKYTDDITHSESAKLLKNSAAIGEKFLFVIIIVFLLYANWLFIKRRTKSFALFQLIGLSRKDLMRMLGLEQIVIFISTTFIGGIIGLFGSRLLLLIIKNVAHLPLEIKIAFEPQALGVTLVLVILSFLLIMIQSYLFLKQRSIIQMMNDIKQTEAPQAQITKRDIFLGILGIVMIGIGYYFSVIMLKYASLLMTLIPLILLTTVLGAYFFFRSSVSLIFKALKKSKHGYVNVTDVVFTASIMHRMKKNAFSLTAIGIISAITITVLSFAAIGQANIQRNVDIMSPHEFTYMKEKSAQQFENQLKSHHIPYDKNVLHMIDVSILKEGSDVDGNYTVTPVVSDKEIDDVQVNKGEVTFVNGFSVSNNFSGLKKGIQMRLGNEKKYVQLKVKDISNQFYVANRIIIGQSLAVVNDNDFKTLQTTQLNNKESGPTTQIGYDLKDEKDIKAAEKWNQQYNKEIPQNRSTLLTEQLQFSGMFLFVSSFLGIAFLIAAGCIIYIKQMDETEDEMQNYRILRKMGYTHQDMFKGLAFKVVFNFGLPLIIGLLHAGFAARAFNELMDGQSFIPVFIAMGVYTIIYFIFALLAYMHSRRSIKYSI